MTHKHVLVTGGAGFIGSHLAEALLRRGAALTIVDNLNDFYSPAWKRANLNDVRVSGAYTLHECDICDLPALRKAFLASRPEAVIHLAAYAGVRPSIQKPRLYEQVNVAGTLNLLEMIREFRIPKLIFGSSSSVYGNSSMPPFRENDVQLRPISPYAATKLAAELLAYTYAHLYGISTVCLRFFTVYGPRQRPDLAIHKFVAAFEAGMPIPVYGDGTAGRDYTFVDDIVSGILAALDHEPMAAGVPFDVFNLGNSSPVTLNHLLSCLEEATGQTAIRQQLPLQAGDVNLTWASVEKSSAILGYRPQTDLRTGIQHFVEWYRSAGNDRKLTLPATAVREHLGVAGSQQLVTM